MRHPGTHEVVETVVVIEHPAFTELYEKALGAEGLTPIVRSASDATSTITNIFPEKNGELEIEIPRLSQAHRLSLVELQSISLKDV